LEEHLTDDQIEELLRQDERCLYGNDLEGGDAVRQAGRREVSAAAELHLTSCDLCRSKVKAMETAVEQFEFLKASPAAKAGTPCPPADVWFQIAAGVESADAENCLNHAIHCEVCGQMLAHEAADLSAELTPQEEEQIGALSSSSADWQMRLAAKLQSGGADAQTVGPGRHPWFAAAVALFTPSRMALAAAFMAAVVLGTQDYRLQDHLADHAQRTAAEIHRLELNSDQQQAQIAELTAQHATPAATASPVAQLAERDSIASLSPSVTLDAGLTRGSGEMKRLRIPASAQFVRITLHARQSTEGIVREELLTVDGRKLWAQELQPSEAESKAGSLSLLIPTYLLSPDDYIVRLSHQAAGGSEQIASYSFRVPR